MQQGKRAWGPEQVIGPPDTPEAGDFQTAWASLTEDTQDEWLQLDYADEVAAIAVLVHENYNPGALYKVSKDPTAVGSRKGVSAIPIQIDFKTKRVKIYLASKDTPGWNEIDAVGLRDEAGKVYWATAATASSTYAQQQQAVPLMLEVELDGLAVERTRMVEMQRLMALEKENRALKKLVAELQDGTKKNKGDAEFIRRIYVDLTGKEPTAGEIKAFTKRPVGWVCFTKLLGFKLICYPAALLAGPRHSTGDGYDWSAPPLRNRNRPDACRFSRCRRHPGTGNANRSTDRRPPYGRRRAARSGRRRCRVSA
jgi:hypothetical protein